MGRRKGSGGGPKPKKRKKVTVKLIPRKHAGDVTEPYRLMEEIRAKEHGHLEGVKIAMAWRLGWRPDANGILTLGKCRKRGDLDRELDSFDFVILLNKEAWQGLNEDHKRALIDHELCHAQVTMDADGQPKLDDCGRFVCRIRKHDVEEFKSVVERHGLYTHDLADIAQAAINDSKRPLLNENESSNGDSEDSDADGDDSDSDSDGDDLAEARAIVKKHRKRAISSVVKNPIYVAKLQEADIKNLGHLLKRMKTYSPWASGITGIGDVAATTIVDDLAEYRQDNPDFTEAELAIEEAEDAEAKEGAAAA